MATPSAELPLATWAPSTSPLVVEYSKAVMEEIRARAVEGYYRLARGGVELAGVLIGEQQGDRIRILAQQPFEIEYAFGPAFLLSARDHAFLRKQLGEIWESYSPLGQQALGLYISHPRGDLCLTETDLALFQDLFPHHWQTMLVLKPSRAPETPAAFFVREPNGLVRANRSHLEFELVPEMGERRARPAAALRPEDPSLRALASASMRPESAEPVPAIRQLGIDRTPAPGAEDHPVPTQALREEFPAPLPPPPLISPQTAEAEEASLSSAPAAEPPITLEQARQMVADIYPQPTQMGQEAPDSTGRQLRSPSPKAEDRGAAAASWEEEPASGPRASSRLRFAIPAIALLLLVTLGYLVYLALNSQPPKVVFFAQETPGGAEVVWQLSGIRDATSAVITVEHNGQRKSLDLIQTGRLSGSWSDPLLTRDALVVLQVERRSAPTMQRVAPWLDQDSGAAMLADSERSQTAIDGQNAGGESGTGGEPRAGGEPGVVNGAPGQDAMAAAGTATPTQDDGRLPQGITGAASSAAPGPAMPGAAVSPITPSIPAPSAATGLAPVRENLPSPASPQPPAVAQGGLGTRAMPPAGGLNPVSPVGRTNTGPEIRTVDAVSAADANGPAAAAPSPDAARRSAAPEQRPAGQGLAGAPAAATPPSTARPAGAEPPVAAAPATLPAPVSLPKPRPPVASPSVPPTPARAQAGRVIWTGQLRKNQVLQLNASDVNQGVLNGKLPGRPIRLSVLPGELTSEGLVVYTANPRYRDRSNSVEEPGPTNGWNQTRYRYDPVRANSVIVTAIPNQTNRWQGLTVRNDDKTVNVIVIDWLADDGD